MAGETPRKSWRGAALLVACVAFIGCHADTQTPTLAPVARADFVDKLAAAVCDAIGPCCEATGNLHDPVRCRSDFATGFRVGHSEFEVANVRADYDPMAAARCLDTVTRVIGACGVMSPKQQQACQQIFKNGRLAPGAACSFGVECAPARDPGTAVVCSGFGQPPSPPTCSIVTTNVVAGAGEACDGDVVVTPDSQSWTGGVPCSAADGLRCDFDRGVCTPLPQLGEPCAWQLPADPTVTWYDACADGAYCDPITEVCVPQRPTGPCFVTIDGATVMTLQACAAGTYCDPGDSAPDYQCRPELPLGAACAWNASCVAHVCTEQHCGIGSPSACQSGLYLF
jgi:hypothetical protein